ncbi:MAG: 50S ribosomal protein L25 [Melioribacteraceae bacterium]|jgi:large subunit ribosomal protein L25|nr:50S ribosomal protein L25 [Ignavibacteriota bacterium]MBZ0181107.1 50S ribosomal protein L25 [Melioribacteraceae bacterium]
MADLSLKAEKRSTSTKGELNDLRKTGLIPGVFYAKDQGNFTIAMHENQLKKIVYTSEAHIVSLDVEGQTYRCILKDIQFDPLTDKMVHFDLQGVTAGQIMQMQVPIVLKGSAKGVKEGGVLEHHLTKVDVECLPKHLPENIEINVSELRVGDSISCGDLELENVKILNNPDSVIVGVSSTRAEEEETADVDLDEEVQQPEVIKKGKAEDEE